MFVTLLLVTIILSSCSKNEELVFDGNNAFQYAKTQVDFGPRIPGSEAHQSTVDWVVQELEKNGWNTFLQTEDLDEYQIKNIVGHQEGSADTQEKPWIILAAHYDSRFFADRDPDPENHRKPVPGGNDGASGVAVLLELSRVIPKDLNKNVWLVFFDAEDQGQIENWDWILGSRSFVNTLTEKPDQVIILDMIGDADLNIYYERNSDPELQEEIWQIAADLGYAEYFIPEYKYSILDDHIPFLENDITAIDIIDFDYKYWHTIEDTEEKISAKSLEIVGETILQWLKVP